MLKSLAIPFLALVTLTACGEDIARQVGEQNGAPVYQIYAKTPLPNDLSRADEGNSPMARAERQKTMREMGMSVCPDGYTPLGRSETNVGYWRRGESGAAFNVEAREMQRIVCR